jgi:general secretion pathway protein K
MVLIAVLWSIALLSALAMAAAMTFRGFAGIMAVERDKLQAEALLTAGLEMAAGAIGSLGETPLNEIEITVTLSTGSVRARLSDEGGRIDIAKAPVEVLVALFRYIGAPEAAGEEIAQRIVEQRRPTTGDRAPSADRPFTDVRQLARVPGMEPEWALAVAPLTTVFGTATVNPLTAPAEVIAALPGVDQGQLDAFLETRRTSLGEASVLVATLGPTQRYLQVKTQQIVSVHLTATLVDGYTDAAQAIIVRLPADTQPYRVLVWDPLPSPSSR